MTEFKPLLSRKKTKDKDDTDERTLEKTGNFVVVCARYCDIGRELANVNCFKEYQYEIYCGADFSYPNWTIPDQKTSGKTFLPEPVWVRFDM